MQSKRYYWLRLKKDFFTDKRIKKLRSIAGGDTYTIIYLKMQLLSLQDDGFLYFEEVEDTFEDEIALQIDEDVENVRVTLAFLLKNKLLNQIDSKTYELIETRNCIGSESEVTERVRRSRERKKIESQSKKMLQCNIDETKCNTEKEIEKEIEKKKDKKEIKKEKFFENEEVNNIFIEFLQLRKKLKAVNSDRAITLLINQLNKYDDDIKIKMIEQSILNSWKSVYELKKQKKEKESFYEMLDKWAEKEE